MYDRIKKKKKKKRKAFKYRVYGALKAQLGEEDEKKRKKKTYIRKLSQKKRINHHLKFNI